MKLLIAVAVLVFLFAPALAQAQALSDTTAVLKKAREYAPFVSANDPGPLWKAFDASMRKAMEDSLSFAKTLDAIHLTTGVIKRTFSEEVSQERGVWVYKATCEFAALSEPAILLIALDPDGKIAGLAVRPQQKEFASTKLTYVTKTPLELPFRGEWFVFWGGRTIKQNYHAVSKSQRFAYDLIMVNKGVSHTGDGKKLTDYYCFGQDVIAPGAGTIVWSCDSLANNEIGRSDTKHPVGNGVVIDHGNGEFSLLAHLQPKTLRFKVGDKVKAGDVLGKCGNSGNTSEPHIHFHMQDGPDFTKAEGLPVTFTGICVDGKKMEKAEPVKGQSIKRCP